MTNAVLRGKPNAGNPHIAPLQCYGGRAAFIAAVLAFGGAALPTLHADTYQFIISGYPAANERYAGSSPATSLATSTQSGAGAASPLEARYRTWDESDGVSLRSDKFRGLHIVFR